MERRFTAKSVAPAKVARKKDDDKEYKRIEGYAAVFYREGDDGTEYQLGTDYFERIDRDAFNEALERMDDVRALFNHDDDNLLGRVSSGTLALSVDDVGLRYSIAIDEDDSDHLRVAAKIERGDLTGSSFAFAPERVEWIDGEKRTTRIIKSVRLYDVGPVTFPAYEASTAQLRDGSTALDELKAYHEAKANKAAAIRQRVAEIRHWQAMH